MTSEARGLFKRMGDGRQTQGASGSIERSRSSPKDEQAEVSDQDVPQVPWQTFGWLQTRSEGGDSREWVKINICRKAGTRHSCAFRGGHHTQQHLTCHHGVGGKAFQLLQEVASICQGGPDEKPIPQPPEQYQRRGHFPVLN